MAAIVYDTTITKTLKDVSFDSLPLSVLKELFEDGRIFSHFMERIIARDYDLTHVSGCKGHDLVDSSDSEIKYEQKSFTKNGCNLTPSNMIGVGRHFDSEVFHEKAKKLIYVVCSNVHFPEIKIRFIKGVDVIALYPKGKITLKGHDAFFS
jgi:hypothetical protein